MALLMFAETSVTEIEEAFQQFSNRKDIAIVLINQNVSNYHVKSNIQYPGPRGFLSPRRDKREERERSSERKPLVTCDANLNIML